MALTQNVGHASPVSAPLSVVQSGCVCSQAPVCSLLWGPSREILCLEQGEPVRLEVIDHVRALPAAIWMKNSVLNEEFRCQELLVFVLLPKTWKQGIEITR